MTPKNRQLVAAAIKEYIAAADTAFCNYTNGVVLACTPTPIVCALPKPHHKDFNNKLTYLRAKLAQNIGAASKSAKGMIIRYYIDKIANDKTLDLTTREAQVLVIYAAGRSVNKNDLAGKFNKADTRNAPPLTPSDLPPDLLKHKAVVQLAEAVKGFNAAKPAKLHNPYQKTVNGALDSLGELYKNHTKVNAKNKVRRAKQTKLEKEILAIAQKKVMTAEN